MWINPFKQAATLGVDVRIAQRWSIDAMGGMFLNSETFAFYKGESYRGPRMRLGFKYFADQSGDFYIGLESKYHLVKNKQWVNVSRQGDQYQELMLLERKVDSRGLLFRTGFQLFSGKKNQFSYDLYVGAGYIRHTVTDFQAPPDGEVFPERGELFNFEIPAGEKSLFDVIGGLHLGYAIR
jgi:hypothetical protein